jgi:hypothetical protein
MDVRDPNARFLGEASAYISNLVQSDREISEERVNADRTAQSIIAVLKTAHDNEIRDWAAIESPPKRYSAIAQKLQQIHKDHNSGWTEWVNVFNSANDRQMNAHIDKGDALVKKSIKDINVLGNIISQALERDVNR